MLDASPPSERPSLVASFDLGTTTAKGVLVDITTGSVVAEGSVEYPTAHGEGGTIEQEPADWWAATCTLAQGFWRAGHDPGGVAMIALTGQMQDVVMIDEAGQALGPAILYSDARAGDEAATARAVLERSGVPAAEASIVDATAPLAKLLWLRAHEPARWAACRRVLFGAKDYVLARLTGVAATDATTAGTTASLDPLRRQWRAAWWAALGLDPALLPALLPAGGAAGVVADVAAAQTGFAPGTPVAAGMGDAAAATLAAGVVAPGDVYLYLGTSAWAATVCLAEDAPAGGRGSAGQFYLPYVVPGTLIAAAPLLNAGSAHHWIMMVLGLRRGEEYDYDGFESLLAAAPARSAGALFLPYLNGERCPVQEGRPMGTFLRLGARTGPAELAWAVLEGITFSLRQVLEALGSLPREVRLVGGMARSGTFRQLVADVCGVTVHTPALPATGTALAAALPVTVTLGRFATLDEGVHAWLPAPAGTVSPDPARARDYQDLYRAYQRIYPLVARLDG